LNQRRQLQISCGEAITAKGDLDGEAFEGKDGDSVELEMHG